MTWHRPWLDTSRRCPPAAVLHAVPVLDDCSFRDFLLDDGDIEDLEKFKPPYSETLNAIPLLVTTFESQESVRDHRPQSLRPSPHHDSGNGVSDGCDITTRSR